jgi:hypothetical protein
VSVRYVGRVTVQTEFPDVGDHWFRVKVYDTDDELQKVAAGMCGQPPSSWKGTIGCFHAADNPGRYLGLMRLSDEHMSPELIIHESVHAAATLARTHFDSDLELPEDVGDHEELVAYATDAIAGSLLRSAILTERPRQESP